MRTTFASIALGLVSAASALNPIVIRGNAFFDSVTGDRFYIRGVDYQPGGSSAINADPLANGAACKRDIPYMQSLGANAMRVYATDNSANHTECMNLLEEAGIYLILDVNTPHFSINRNEPWDSYNAVYLQHVFATIDAFKGYNNLMAFFAGNEVIMGSNTTMAAAWVKATVRDMKLYIQSQSSRSIPVGYSAADISSNRVLLAEYLNCGSDATARSDFYSFNQYEWCGYSSFEKSGFADRVEDFQNYSIPLFFSEFGCNLVQPRPFTEIQSIYSKNMTSVFSGGLVYEWTEEANNYGLVEVNNISSVSPLQDFYNLKNQYQLTPNPTGDGGYNPSGQYSTCPGNSTDFETWAVLPPTPAQALQYIKLGAGNATGNSGNGSQWLGPDATSTVTPGNGTNSGSSTDNSGEKKSGSAMVEINSMFLSIASFGTLIALSGAMVFL